MVNAEQVALDDNEYDIKRRYGCTHEAEYTIGVNKKDDLGAVNNGTSMVQLQD